MLVTNYINYLDRDEAKNKNDFSLYNNYMADKEIATSLFSEHDDQLDDGKKDRMKEAFKLAQERGSILYQDVVSFDNKSISPRLFNA
ncbi:relaxase MobL [Halalkalibacter lacteus]|uniref:relaxase MobL n=1 Tax=Halalkalibacter lacteus TaxID=3090663 RepID=UPI003D66EB7A